MTDTLVWDEAGTRYYETGVSKAIYFDMDMVGVVWNGLIAVNLDPQGGESEPLYFDGVKFSNKTLAEDFQASIQAINTPREFEAAEGIRPLKDSFGGKTHFNNRAKFNMCWRTEIGNDEGEAVAYKLHIAYNCVVQPSGRAYQTISDNTSPDIRTFVITATPACGRHSYFTFDSRDGDLSDLEAQLYSGVLPRCYELAALTQQISGGDGGSADPDADCDFIFTDFEQFNPGQILDLEEVEVDNKDYFVTGQINNGLTITNLPATGAYAANDSAASEVGTGNILADDDDATYISSADGDLGYTVGLPSLVGYREGAGLELHIRMSISGGVNPDDPDNLDADAQVHISTDATGDNTIGGFSDGTDEGMGFALTVVDGTPTDYVIPLNMDSWVDTDLDDVVDALIAGAYLNVVGASNNNPDTTPALKVYEASIVVIDDTDQEKYLMAVPEDIFSVVEQHIYSSGTTDVVAANKVSVEFKFIPTPYDSDADTWYQEIMLWEGGGPALLKGDVHFGDPRFELVDTDTGDSLVSFIPQKNVWYKAEIDWTWGSYTFEIFQDNTRVYDEGTRLPYVVEQDTTQSPTGSVKHIGGLVSQAGVYNKSYHIVTDNAKMQIHCHEEAPEMIEEIYRFQADPDAVPGAPLLNGSTLTSGSSIQSGLSDDNNSTSLKFPVRSDLRPWAYLKIVPRDLTAYDWTEATLEFVLDLTTSVEADILWELYIQDASDPTYHSLWHTPYSFSDPVVLSEDLPVANSGDYGVSDLGAFTVENLVNKAALADSTNAKVSLQIWVPLNNATDVYVHEIRLKVRRPA